MNNGDGNSMTKLIAICGKICSGKSYYSKVLKEKENAVILPFLFLYSKPKSFC